MQSVQTFASNLSDSLGGSCDSSILSFADHCNKAVPGMKRSVIWNSGCCTNTIKASHHFFSDWLLKGLELSHTQSIQCKKGFSGAGSCHCVSGNSFMVVNCKSQKKRAD